MGIIKEIYDNNIQLNELKLGKEFITYARHKHTDILQGTYTKGYQPSLGNVYGDAFFSTFELEPQLNRDVRKLYGDCIVRYKTDVVGFFYCDWQEFIKSYLYTTLKSTQDSYIEDQMQYYKIVTQKDDVSRIKTLKKANTYNNELALYMINELHIEKYVTGMIFNSRKDTKVMACYDMSKVKPRAISGDDGRTFLSITPGNLSALHKMFKERHSRSKDKRNKNLAKARAKNPKVNPAPPESKPEV